MALGGRIELDPMSEACFQDIVQAERYYTAEDDAFRHTWRAETVLINPPGGMIVKSWRYLMQEVAAGRTRRAIWIGFSVEQYNLLADETHQPIDFQLLIPRKRIRFVRHDGYCGSPSHGNFVVGIRTDLELFCKAFDGLGRIHMGRFA